MLQSCRVAGQGGTMMNWSLFRGTADLSTVTQTRPLCIQLKNSVHDLKDQHSMKCLGRKCFPTKHDIFCFSPWGFKENECMYSLDFFIFSFLVSFLPQSSLLQSQTVTVLCASPGRGSSQNINLILLMKTLFIQVLECSVSKEI